MASTQNIQLSFNDGMIQCSCTLCLDDNDSIVCIFVKFWQRDFPKDISDNVFVSDYGTTDLNFCYENNFRIQGSLRLINIVNIQGSRVYALWAELFSGMQNEYHFEGVAVEFGAYSLGELSSQWPIPRDGTSLEAEINQEVRQAESELADDLSGPPGGLGSSGDCDVFPYIFVRPLPPASKREIVRHFAGYSPCPLTPALDTLFKRLTESTGLRRSEAEAAAWAYIRGRNDLQPPFVQSQLQLKGPGAEFAEVIEALRSWETFDPTELSIEIESALAMGRMEIVRYLQSYEYGFLKERIWQSYFALTIVADYDAGLLDFCSNTLIAMHLVETLFTEPERSLSEGSVEALVFGGILLPEQLYPLPPAETSPPAEHKPDCWIHHYATGDLQMTRCRLLRYEAGEVAHIENLMPGERRKHRKRTLSRVDDVHSRESMDLSLQKTGTQEAQSWAISETLTSVTDSILKTSYDNFTTSYGPLTSAKLSGGWSSELSPGNGGPGKNKGSSFARDVLARATQHIGKTLRKTRAISSRNEAENASATLLDNSAGSGSVRAVYRWINKVYSASVVKYGRRLLVELCIKDPAAQFRARMQKQLGTGLAEPVPPATLGIHSYEDIHPDTYAAFAARFDAIDISPAPAQTRTVSTSFQHADSRQLAIPDGYVATEAFLSHIFTEGASHAILEGLIGRSSFRISYPQSATERFTLQEQDGTVAVAIFDTAAASSPPAATFLATVEISCSLSAHKLNEWQLQTYNAIVEGYERQRDRYTQLMGGESIDSGQAELANRRIEKHELRRSSIRMLMQRGEQLRGGPAREAVSPPCEPIDAIRFRQFISDSFEWNEMMYSFEENLMPADRSAGHAAPAVYPGGDSLFATFYQAEAARVIVPVRPEFAPATLYYLSTGLVWPGKLALAPATAQVADAALAVKEQPSAPSAIIEESEAWEFVIPTTMQYLQDGEELPVLL